PQAPGEFPGPYFQPDLEHGARNGHKVLPPRQRSRPAATEKRAGVSFVPAGTAVEVTLEDDHRGDFINVVTALPPFETHFFKMLFGGKTGQAFIPEHNGK